MMFVIAVNTDDDEEGSTDDEKEKMVWIYLTCLMRYHMDTDDIIETIETIDALEQDLFAPLTPSPVAHTTTAT